MEEKKTTGKKYLLVHAEQGIPADLLPLSADWSEAQTVSGAMQIMENEQDLCAVFVDTPSEIPEVRALIDYMNNRNNDLLAVPMLILTDGEHIPADEQYLGGAVIDCMEKPVRPAVLKNRLANAEQQVSSVSFTEFSRMLRSLPANIYLKDNHGRYVFSSQTWHHLNTDNDPNWTIRGKTDLDIRKDKENAQRALESDLKLVQTGIGTSYIIEENDGQQEFLQIIKEPLFYEDGRVRGIIALINVVTEQEQLRRKLREQYITDRLTGLHNRSFYSECIAKFEADPPEIMSIVIGDCDHLKVINDTYGHPAGNEYIISCANLLRECMPENSLIFRTGGDEFVTFLPDVTAEETEKLIRRIREREKAYVVKDRTLSVSFGYYTMKKGEKLTRCIEAADNNMYKDKQQRKMARE